MQLSVEALFKDKKLTELVDRDPRFLRYAIDALYYIPRLFLNGCSDQLSNHPDQNQVANYEIDSRNGFSSYLYQRIMAKDQHRITDLQDKKGDAEKWEDQLHVRQRFVLNRLLDKQLLLLSHFKRLQAEILKSESCSKISETEKKVSPVCALVAMLQGREEIFHTVFPLSIVEEIRTKEIVDQENNGKRPDKTPNRKDKKALEKAFKKPDVERTDINKSYKFQAIFDAGLRSDMGQKAFKYFDDLLNFENNQFKEGNEFIKVINESLPKGLKFEDLNLSNLKKDLNADKFISSSVELFDEQSESEKLRFFVFGEYIEAPEKRKMFVDSINEQTSKNLFNANLVDPGFWATVSDGKNTRAAQWFQGLFGDWNCQRKAQWFSALSDCWPVGLNRDLLESIKTLRNQPITSSPNGKESVSTPDQNLDGVVTKVKAQFCSFWPDLKDAKKNAEIWSKMASKKLLESCDERADIKPADYYKYTKEKFKNNLKDFSESLKKSGLPSDFIESFCSLESAGNTLRRAERKYLDEEGQALLGVCILQYHGIKNATSFKKLSCQRT